MSVSRKVKTRNATEYHGVLETSMNTRAKPQLTTMTRDLRVVVIVFVSPSAVLEFCLQKDCTWFSTYNSCTFACIRHNTYWR